MYKISSCRSPFDLINKNFTGLLTIVLVVLFAFNLGWLISLIRLYNRFKIVADFDKSLFGFESILLLGNLGILIVFVAYLSIFKILRSIIGR